MTIPLPPSLQDCDRAADDPETLAAIVEAAEEGILSAALTGERMRAVKTRALSLMTQALGPGECAVAPSGRVAYQDQVRDGRGTVNTAAVDEHEADLPVNLVPSTRRVYPTIQMIRRSLRDGLITRELAAELITEAPLRDGIRWRTMQPDTTIGSQE